MSGTTPIGGYGDLSYNGTTLPFRGEMTWNAQVFSAKGVAGRDGRVHGALLEPMVPFIEGTFTFDGSYTTSDLVAIQGATVSATLATGMQIVLRGGFVAGEITPEADEAKLKIRFEGSSCEELKAPGT